MLARSFWIHAGAFVLSFACFGVSLAALVAEAHDRSRWPNWPVTGAGVDVVALGAVAVVVGASLVQAVRARRLPKGVPALQQAVAKQRRRAGRSTWHYDRLIDLLTALGAAHLATDDNVAALVAFDEAVALTVQRMRDGAGPRFARVLARALRNRALALSGLGRFDDALAASAESVRLVRSASTPERDQLADSLRVAGAVLIDAGRRDEARVLVDEALSLEWARQGTRPAALARTLLLRALVVAPGSPEAVAATAQAVSVLSRTGEPTLSLVSAHGAHAVALQAAQRPDDALSAMIEAVMAARDLHRRGRVSPAQLAGALHQPALEMTTAGHFALALVAADEAVALRISTATDGPDHDRAYALHLRGHLLFRTGRAEEGRADNELAVQMFRPLMAQGQVDVLRELTEALTDQAEMCVPLGRVEEGLAAVDEAIAVRREIAADPRWLSRSLRVRAELLRACGRDAEADEAAREAEQLTPTVVET